MPGMDRTGPLGNGPVGRGMGPCSGSNVPAFWGRGKRFLRGGGVGPGLCLGDIPAPERASLEVWRDALKAKLEWVEKRLEILRQAEK